MIKHLEINNVELHQKVKRKEISYGGNSKLKITEHYNANQEKE